MILIADVQRAVAADFNVPTDLFFSNAKAAHVAHPRQYAMLIAREVTRHSTTVLGRAFRRDHSTVLFGLKRAKERIANDPELALKLGARKLLLEMGK